MTHLPEGAATDKDMDYWRGFGDRTNMGRMVMRADYERTRADAAEARVKALEAEATDLETALMGVVLGVATEQYTDPNEYGEAGAKALEHARAALAGKGETDA